MNILIPLFSIIILVSINIILSYRENKLYWLYEASHFMCGFLLAVLLLNFLDKNFVLLAILMVSFVWEIYELIINRNQKIKRLFEDKFRYHITPSTFSDAILDILLNVLGAMFYLYLF